jgi:hypothetical protein
VKEISCRIVVCHVIGCYGLSRGEAEEEGDQGRHGGRQETDKEALPERIRPAGTGTSVIHAPPTLPTIPTLSKRNHCAQSNHKILYWPGLPTIRLLPPPPARLQFPP